MVQHVLHTARLPVPLGTKEGRKAEGTRERERKAAMRRVDAVHPWLVAKSTECVALGPSIASHAGCAVVWRVAAESASALPPPPPCSSPYPHNELMQSNSNWPGCQQMTPRHCATPSQGHHWPPAQQQAEMEGVAPQGSFKFSWYNPLGETGAVLAAEVGGPYSVTSTESIPRILCHRWRSPQACCQI